MRRHLRRRAGSGGWHQLWRRGRGLLRRRPVDVRRKEREGRGCYAKFVGEKGLDEVVTREDHIGLRCGGLGELEEDAGCLGEALG